MLRYYWELFRDIPSKFRGTVTAWVFWGGGVPAFTLLNRVLGSPINLPDIPPVYALGLLGLALVYAVARVNYDRFVGL